MATGRRRTFDDLARRERGPAAKLFLLFFAVAAAAMLWAQRGVVVGAIALVVYGGIFLVAALNHRGLLAWSRRHVVLDALFLAPFTFLALALITDWPIGLCALLGAVAGGLLVPVALKRRRAG